MQLYDTFANRTVITGVLVALDPVHIGSSEKESLNPVEPDSPVLRDAAGNPVIPGSTLKGAVRTQFERVMRTVRGARGSCGVFGRENCIDPHQRKSMTARQIYEQSCETCRLFGGIGIAGKLRFKDAFYIPENGRPCRYEKRDGVAIDRDTGAARGGAKFDFEVVPKGSRFRFTLIAENLGSEQMPCLEVILAMLRGEWIEGDFLAFGGKTTRGLGRMQLTEVRRSAVTAETLRGQLLGLIKE